MGGGWIAGWMDGWVGEQIGLDWAGLCLSDQTEVMKGVSNNLRTLNS